MLFWTKLKKKTLYKYSNSGFSRIQIWLEEKSLLIINFYSPIALSFVKEVSNYLSSFAGITLPSMII